MTQAVTYQRETKAVAFQGKTIVLENLTPVFPPKEKERRKKELVRLVALFQQERSLTWILSEKIVFTQDSP